MTGLTTLTLAGVLGALALPILAPLPAPTAARAAEGTLRYRVTLNQRSKEYNGKEKEAPTGRFETIVSGNNARADVVAGGKDLKTGDVLLTNDGGDTIYWIRGRSYVQMDADYREKITREVAGKMKMSISNGRVDSDSTGGSNRGGSRGGDGEQIAGLATSHGRFRRSFDLGVKVMLMSVKVAYEDHIDVWAATDLAGAPSIEASFYNTFINMVPFADAEMQAGTEAAAAKLPRGLVVKWSHASVTRKDDGSTEEGETMIVVSDLKRGAASGVEADAARFALPEGLRRVEKH